MIVYVMNTNKKCVQYFPKTFYLVWMETAFIPARQKWHRGSSIIRNSKTIAVVIKQ